MAVRRTVVVGVALLATGCNSLLGISPPHEGGPPVQGIDATVPGSDAGGTGNDAHLDAGIDAGSGPAAWTVANGAMWGGMVHTVAIALTGGPAGLVYAGTNNGVYKTTDGGATWARTSSGLDNAIVNAIALGSIDGATVFASVYGGDAGNGVYRSDNGGQSWQRVLGGGFQTWLLVSSVDASGHFVFYVLDSTDTVHRSTDGITWSSIGTLPVTVTALPQAMVVDPRTDIVYIDGDAVYSNAGGTWAAAGTGLPPYSSTYVRDSRSIPRATPRCCGWGPLARACTAAASHPATR
jgi:hypothetical protein